MTNKNNTIRLNGKLRFGCGDVIAIYGNAARNTQGLGRCIATASQSPNGYFGPFFINYDFYYNYSCQIFERLLLVDAIGNNYEVPKSLEAILTMEPTIKDFEGYEKDLLAVSAVSCQWPREIINLTEAEIKEFKPDILIISGAEDILENVRSLAEVRKGLRWIKRIAQDINGIVILEFGLNQSNLGLIKTELIDHCNYAFHTEEDKSTGRITATATRWEGKPIPTMYIDTDPEGAPTITIDEAEGE